MGQKINPKTIRLGSLYNWASRWFVTQDEKYRQMLLQDIKIRKELMQKLKPAGIAQVEIERSINKIDIILYVSRPGIVIGRGGTGLEQVRKTVEQIVNKKQNKKNSSVKGIKIEVKVEPIKEPNLNAYLVAMTIADQLAKRLPYRRVVSHMLEKVMSAGAKGVKISLSGRIAGAEICRRETFKIGKIPLSTLREEIDFASFPSLTRSGYIGVKVWICK